MRHSALAVLFTCLAAAPAAADVTIKSIVKTTGPAAASGESTVWIKGSRMRIDEALRGEKTTLILDAGAGEMTVFNHAKSEAIVFNLTPVVAELQKIPAADVKAELKPTDGKREIARFPCTEHSVRVVVNHEAAVRVPPGQPAPKPERMTIVINGPVCLSSTAPGRKEYAAFYQQAAKKGLLLSDPRTSLMQPAHARSMMALFKTIAEGGVPLAMDVTTTFEGGGPMASMMARLGATGRATEVVSITAAPVPADTFSVPKTYTVTRR